MKDRTTKHARNSGLRNRTRKPQYSHSPLLPMFVVSPNSQHQQARRAIFYPVLGDSIFSSDGAVWKHSRALLRPYFSRDNINNLAATQSAADALIRIVVSGGKAPESSIEEEEKYDGSWTQPTDLLPLFFNFTMDTSTEFLFGEAVGALAAVEREMSNPGSGISKSDEVSAGNDAGYGSFAASDEFSEALRIANDGLVMRLRLQNLYWLGDGFAFRKATRRVQGFVDGFVSKALAKVDSERTEGEVDAQGKKSSNNKKYGLLESLLEQTRDREELIAQTLGEISHFLLFPSPGLTNQTLPKQR
jgi:hypothetical protein